MSHEYFAFSWNSVCIPLLSVSFSRKLSLMINSMTSSKGAAYEKDRGGLHLI